MLAQPLFGGRGFEFMEDADMPGVRLHLERHKGSEQAYIFWGNCRTPSTTLTFCDGENFVIHAGA